VKTANLTLILCFIATALFAQQTDFATVIQPVETKARDFQEYLVQLAWLNRPESSIAEAEVRNARDDAKNTNKEWMRDVQATFNLNEANLRNKDTSGSVFFPRYNFGLNLNLYNILTQGTKNKISRREIEVAEHRVNQRKLEIRSETLARYAGFKLAKEILKTRSLVEQESQNNYILMQQLYRTDEKTFDEYATASSAYFQAQEARIRADSEVQVAKFRLEEMIGLRWEQVQHPAKEE
jgi:outer membrane protein TolC